MLPPRQHQADLAAGEMLGMGEQRGEAGGAGALGHRLLDLEQQRDGALDRDLVDRQHPVEQGAGDATSGSLPMSRTAMPSAMVSPPAVTGSPARSWRIAE